MVVPEPDRKENLRGERNRSHNGGRDVGVARGLQPLPRVRRGRGHRGHGRWRKHRLASATGTCDTCGTFGTRGGLLQLPDAASAAGLRVAVVVARHAPVVIRNASASGGPRAVCAVCERVLELKLVLELLVLLQLRLHLRLRRVQLIMLLWMHLCLRLWRRGLVAAAVVVLRPQTKRLPTPTPVHEGTSSAGAAGLAAQDVRLGVRRRGRAQRQREQRVRLARHLPGRLHGPRARQRVQRDGPRGGLGGGALLQQRQRARLRQRRRGARGSGAGGRRQRG